MVKFIWKEADENSPIYKTGFIVSSVKLNKSKVKTKRKGDNKWKNCLFSQFLEAKQGKKPLK